MQYKNRKSVIRAVFIFLTLLLPKGHSDEIRNIKNRETVSVETKQVKNYTPFLPTTIHSLSSKFLLSSKVLVTRFLEAPLAIDLDQYLNPYRIDSVITSSGFLSSDLTHLPHRHSLNDFPVMYYYQGAAGGFLAYDLKFRLWSGDDNVSLLFYANNIDNDWMEGQLSPFYLNDVQLSIALGFWFE